MWWFETTIISLFWWGYSTRCRLLLEDPGCFPHVFGAFVSWDILFLSIRPLFPFLSDPRVYHKLLLYGSFLIWLSSKSKNGKMQELTKPGPEIMFPHILVPKTSHRTSPYKEKANRSNHLTGGGTKGICDGKKCHGHLRNNLPQTYLFNSFVFLPQSLNTLGMYLSLTIQIPLTSVHQILLST